MASLDYSVFVSDYDHNAPNPEYLAQTHEKLYKTIRAAHPDVPVVFVGRPDFWLTVKENPYRRDVIYTTYKTRSSAAKRCCLSTVIRSSTATCARNAQSTAATLMTLAWLAWRM